MQDYNFIFVSAKNFEAFLLGHSSWGQKGGGPLAENLSELLENS